MTTFTFDGRPVPFLQGQTVAAALIADGVYSWHRTRGTGEPRGLFCGIGVCFDCLLVVNSEPNQRACLLIATADLTVATQIGTGHDDLAG